MTRLRWQAYMVVRAPAGVAERLGCRRVPPSPPLPRTGGAMLAGGVSNW